MVPPNSNGAFTGNATVQAGKSFVSLFQKDSHVQHSGAKVAAVHIKGSKYPLHCMNHSIHGVVKDLGAFKSLDNVLSRSGLSNFGLSYVGGLSVLLTLGNRGLVRDVMTIFSEVLSDVFSYYNVWKGEELPSDRVVSVRISGVPVHLRDNSVYDLIGGLFGKVVQESSFSWSVSDNSEGLVLVLVPLGRRIEESVVINWQERRFFVWVAEEVMAWKPDLVSDSHSVDEDLGNTSSEESEEVSDIGGGEEDTNMVDEVEEGEIRSLVLNSSVPEEVNRPPSEPLSEPVNDQSPVNERLGPDRSRAMDGDNEESVPVGLHEVHGESSNHNSENVAAGSYDCGPYHKGVNNINLVDHLDQEGPTPHIGLGKRNRANRSPPSSDSMQGPPIKSFYQAPDPDDYSFDLNRPSSASGVFLCESVGESNQLQLTLDLAAGRNIESASGLPNLNSGFSPNLGELNPVH
ncbi:hypothetical protein Hdeb2414_s0009g00325641 [Helianthus debilis subsp. tardiflorus]